MCQYEFVLGAFTSRLFCFKSDVQCTTLENVITVPGFYCFTSLSNRLNFMIFNCALIINSLTINKEIIYFIWINYCANYWQYFFKTNFMVFFKRNPKRIVIWHYNERANFRDNMVIMLNYFHKQLYDIYFPL